MPIGANVEFLRAEYKYLDLRSLMSLAYGVKPYQITGPDWMATEHFDIVAKMPEGSKKDDAPKMLQALLEERFKLTTHRASAEHPVLALVVGKGGPKLKASAGTPVAIDDSAPLKPGELKMDGSDGPVRVKVDMTTGSSVIDMGLKGKMSYRLDPATQSFHIDFSMTTMAGFADMITQLFEQLGGTGGRQVVDMTGIKGNYDATVQLSLMEIIAMARAAGADIPVGAPGGPGGRATHRGGVGSRRRRHLPDGCGAVDGTEAGVSQGDGRSVDRRPHREDTDRKLIWSDCVKPPEIVGGRVCFSFRFHERSSFGGERSPSRTREARQRESLTDCVLHVC